VRTSHGAGQRAYAEDVEGDRPSPLWTDVLGEDERSALSPRTRRRLTTAVIAVFLASLALEAGSWLGAHRAQQQRTQLATQRADALLLSAQLVGIGSRAVTAAGVQTWTLDLQANTRDGTGFDLQSAQLDEPWVFDRVTATRAGQNQTFTVRLTGTCATVASLRSPTSVLLRGRHPGRRLVEVRTHLQGDLLSRPREDCALQP
jgi:hypothetical protein